MSALVYTPMADKDGPQSLTTHDRNLGNGHQTPSPLKLFVQAKKHINEVFRDIKSYIEESYAFLKDVSVDDNVVSKDDVELVKKHLDKVSGICEVLARNHMKVVFFGRTSNGKSTVVNAMLRNKILPTGIGHTTNCFLQVEGGNSSEAYLLTEDSPEPKSLQSVKELAHALSDVKLDKSSLIRIIWPKEKCSLLKDDVVLVDSPGIDVDPDLDSWIDKHCLDADVFVLVANAESTLMQTEKKFFHKVSERLSKPNIFILNNRWDASASEPEYMEEVKSQHLDRNLAFLSDELGVINRKEAADRVFFVSAKEALISRLNQEEGTPTPQGAMADGFQIRLFEFANFERQFEECISKTAVHTKFEKHAQRGKLITSDLRNVNDQVYSQALEYRNKSIVHRQEKSDKFDYTDKQLSLLTNEIKDKIKLMVENVEGKVSTALNEEIRRLSVLVDEFDRPFHPDIISMNIYKKELHAHVEHTLGRNLQTRCSAALLQAVQNSEKDMTERLLALLPEDQKQQVSNLMPSRDFEMSYRLDCRNLCADFREDIEFRFSLGLTSMMNRFLGPKGARTVLMGYSDAIPRPVPMTPQTPSNECHSIDRHDNEMMMALLTTFASLTSRSTVGAVVVSGLVAKAAGWRVIAVCGTIYGLLYVYERLTWTKKAKERVFKRQYVDHASSKLKLIIDLTSANCSHQVQQELASVFTRLSHQVDHAKSELMDEIKNLDIEIQDVEEIGNKSKILRNKAGWLDNELNNFIQQYLLRG